MVYIISQRKAPWQRFALICLKIVTSWFGYRKCSSLLKTSKQKKIQVACNIQTLFLFYCFHPKATCRSDLSVFHYMYYCIMPCTKSVISFNLISLSSPGAYFSPVFYEYIPWPLDPPETSISIKSDQTYNNFMYWPGHLGCILNFSVPAWLRACHIILLNYSTFQSLQLQNIRKNNFCV